nr:YgjP-like metallopeptidase domain-containing protein [Neobacillus terrae]
MKHSIIYGTKTIEFSIEYRKRKTMEISVEPPHNVSVVAPTNTPEAIILQKVKNKAGWIVQRLYLLKEMEYKKIEREMVNGESFMYLGRNYSLQFLIDKEVKQPIVKLFQGKFLVTSAEKDEDLIRQAFEKWYKR